MLTKVRYSLHCFPGPSWTRSLRMSSKVSFGRAIPNDGAQSHPLLALANSSEASTHRTIGAEILIA